MSGYLRSLSAQALGLTAPVKSAARLRYLAAPALVESWTGDDAVSLPDGSSLPARSRDYAVARVRPLAPPLQASDGTARADGRTDTRSAPDVMESASGVSEYARQDAAPPSTGQPSTTGVVAPPRVPVLPPLVAPAAHFTLPPAPASAAPGGPARRPGAHQPGIANGSTEVHVSIGRIEVTALPEAAPPPRRAVPVRKSMPLNEYLTRRQRGRS